MKHNLLENHEIKPTMNLDVKLCMANDIRFPFLLDTVNK